MGTKSLAEARANFEASISYIPDRYSKGIDRADWATPAKSEQAEKNFADAMSKAITNKSRQKGVAEVTNEEWKDQAKTKGAPIIGERIRGALGTWESNFGPVYAQVQTKVAALPARTVNWRDNINNRLVPVVEQWRKAAGKT